LIKLDGTKNKSKLGANAILGVSLAVCRAGAKNKKLPLWRWISKIAKTRPSLPIPSILFLEGGLHGKGNLDIQEFMAFVGEKSFKEKFKIGTKIYYSLEKILKKRYGKAATKIGMEGAFTPSLESIREALDLLLRAGQENKIKIILDVAANSFFKKGKFYFEKRTLNRRGLLNFYLELYRKYPIVAIEDPFTEEDWQGWKMLRIELRKLKPKVLIIGDDLTVTNPKRIKQAHKKKACNGIIVKPNQIGTVSEVIEAVKLAKSYGWKIMVSHRSGETKDDFIADLAVGVGAEFIKSGAPSRSERLTKYNRLLKIEKELK